MSLGTLLLKARMRLEGGPRTSFWREIVRPRILQSSPIQETVDPACEIHVLTSRQDYLNVLWALKSFYAVSPRKYSLCIHDDGSLTERHRLTLGTHFPAARVLSADRARSSVMRELTGHPRCQQFRLSNHLSPKVFDFRHYLQSERMLLLDSDVLFFSEPTELLSRIEAPDYQCNSVNADINSAYTVDPKEVQRRCGFPLVQRFNSGLGLIHRDSLNLHWIEEFLGLPGILGHFWRIEQTVFALCSSRFGVELLPDKYTVFLDGPLGNRPCRHYVGAIRHLMYTEGIRKLSAARGRWKSTEMLQGANGNC